MTDSLYIAVDLGAGSGRVFLGGVAPGELMLEEVHRFSYPPVQTEGHLRWNFPEILAEVKTGLRRAGEHAKVLGRTIESLGVDSWGVDYGLLDNAGQLLENPVCYRDGRTANVPEKIFAKVSREEIFNQTGIQFLVFNTLFQLDAGSNAAQTAARLLLIPDLINFNLTGRAVAEYTNATTTQMVNAQSKNWDFELLEKLSLPAHLLPEIVPAGTSLGRLKPDVANELNLENVRVIAPATHDTASAVAGTPLARNWAYISSGTWSLVGVERDQALINNEVAQENFTNEGGAFGTIRFLKNVMGLWIFESCRRELKESGFEVGYEELLSSIKAIKGFQSFVFPDDQRFLNPPSMLAAVRQQLSETGQKVFEDPVIILKIILDSLSLRYASVLRTIEQLTEQKIAGVQIVGGGGRNYYLNQMTANACGLPVQAGLIEATVTGNILVQAIAAKRFSALREARNHVRDNIQLAEFRPEKSVDLDNAERRYAQLEMIFTTTADEKATLTA